VLFLVFLPSVSLCGNNWRGNGRLVSSSNTNSENVRIFAAMHTEFSFVPAAQSSNTADTPVPTAVPRAVVMDLAQMADVQRRATAGESEAQFLLGSAYRDGGPIIPQSHAEALKWFRKAADQGLAKAEDAVASMYYNGFGVARSYTDAFEWFSRAARQGTRTSHYALGVMYRRGQGVHRDLAAAVTHLRKAAEDGLPESQNELGMMYWSGEGLTRDPAQAFLWFQASAQQGNASAQNNLGHLYQTGANGPKDYSRALHWFTAAAAKGNPAAQAHLGEMYQAGQGTPLNYVEAYVWFSLSASQRYPIALEAKKSLVHIMTIKQIEAAENQLRERQQHEERQPQQARSGDNVISRGDRTRDRTSH
jgi:TPR repeat protein